MSVSVLENTAVRASRSRLVLDGAGRVQETAELLRRAADLSHGVHAERLCRLAAGFEALVPHLKRVAGNFGFEQLTA